jgi:phosphoribosyl 1,2-cyclic phosphodiesterase
MIVRFWGVRGGIPTPELNKLKFGGNTSCISLELDDGEMLILDGGTGLRQLGNYMLASRDKDNLDAHLLFSHMHWDHIQGIPFFKPLFSSGSTFNFVGKRHHDNSLRNLIESQQNYSYFPVDMAYMSAKKTFNEINGDSFYLGSAKVSTEVLNHPGSSLGYRIQVGDAVICYATDNEHTSDVEPSPEIVKLAKDADILIYDCNYTPEEYNAGREGWGHSTWKHGILNAIAANVKHLILFHHDQDHDDEFMLELEATARAEFADCTAAREEMVINIQENQNDKGLGFDISYPDGNQRVILAHPEDEIEKSLRSIRTFFPENSSFSFDATPMRNTDPDKLCNTIRKLDKNLCQPIRMTNLLPEQIKYLSGLSFHNLIL